MARVAILLITYNSEAELGPCLEAITVFAPDAEVLVIDNASQDRSVEVAARYPVRVIANRENRGFAAAVNQGVRETIAPLLLLLNPDARLQSGIGALVETFDAPTTGAAAGLLLNPDGSPQTGFSVRRLPTATMLIFEVLGLNRFFPTNSVNRSYRCQDLAIDRTIEVEQPAGAFLLFSRTAWQAVGGFDEQFWPVWFEDVDFCAALRRNAWKTWFVPKCTAVHSGGHSVGMLPERSREQYWYVSLLKYGAKHYRTLAFRLLCFAVALGSVLRFLRAAGQGRQSFAIHRAVFRLAAVRLFGLSK